MSKVDLNVLFKKIQKDDKKEVLEFHVQGDELEHSDELVNMAGNIAVIGVENSEVDDLPAEFKSIQRDSKKTVLKFNVKGDSQGKVLKLYEYAGRSVVLLLEPSQMSIEEFEEAHEGLEYKVNPDGTAAVPEGQLSTEDIPTGEPNDVNFDDDELQE
ncbi:hypothetical protein [Gracilibacillus salinarum]|uniref:General stress protein 17M-like domain-containing protein n=1 Tax=Gracilibacillus salinarum TaxID=2932255 RepID=A0ABY4GN63_9BACI|nr:hypothetical protein [Gracilibacillus salinarum]UOQ85679.1 hypothetical protein MUN87_01870 [Gracilibacillus salinarum]